MKPHSDGEKDTVFFLAQNSWEERGETISYQNGGSLALLLPWKVLPERGKMSGILWGSGRIARGVSMAQLECIILKCFFESIFEETRFSPGCC